MRRLFFVPFMTALAVAGSMLVTSPAGALPASATCGPGVVIASSLTATPSVVHVGQPISVRRSIINCTAKTKHLQVQDWNATLPCHREFLLVFFFDLKPHQKDIRTYGQKASTCLGAYSESIKISIGGKVVSQAGYTYTVIK